MKYTSHLKQLSVDMFSSSFDELDKNNRWVKLGNLLPWTELEKVYNARLDNEVKGVGNKPARMIFGACIIKHKFSLSGEDTISMIQENPYMQYLCGLSEFTDKPLFDYTFIDHHSWHAYNERTALHTDSTFQRTIWILSRYYSCRQNLHEPYKQKDPQRI